MSKPARPQSITRPNKVSKSKRGKGTTKIDKTWYQIFQEFQRELALKGIHMRDVSADGNCLFRSISDQAEGSESNHRHYRDLAIKHMKNNSEIFRLFLLEDETLEDYLDDMEQDGTWGGHFELVALSEVLNCAFCLHIQRKEPVIIKGHLPDPPRKIRTYHLAYHVGEHYSSIRKITDNWRAPAREIYFTSASERGMTSNVKDRKATMKVASKNNSKKPTTTATSLKSSILLTKTHSRSILEYPTSKSKTLNPVGFNRLGTKCACSSPAKHSFSIQCKSLCVK